MGVRNEQEAPKLGTVLTKEARANVLDGDTAANDPNKDKWPIVMVPLRGDETDHDPVRGSINGCRYIIPKGVPTQVHPAVRIQLLLNCKETRHRAIKDRENPQLVRLIPYDAPRFALIDVPVDMVEEYAAQQQGIAEGLLPGESGPLFFPATNRAEEKPPEPPQMRV